MKKLIFIFSGMLIALASNAQTKQLWGMTSMGGANDVGLIFQFNPATSTYTKKFDFDGVGNGANPFGSLVQASDGMLYGMTIHGGANGVGVLFQYDPATSTYTKKLDFSNTYGAYPWGSLIQASDGKLYGMTNEGGLNGAGVIFQYDPVTSTYTKKVDFNDKNGDYPEGSLIQASNEKLYGMTVGGGANGVGVLFEYNLGANTYSKKIDLSNLNGYGSYGSLVQASDGKLYGVTKGGAGAGNGVLFQYDPVNVNYTKMLDFSNNSPSNGYDPQGSLMQASDGKLYGVTESGGLSWATAGVIFQYDPTTSTYTKKIDFNGANGQSAIGSLVQASDGKFYGMTNLAGVVKWGVIFKYDPSASTLTNILDFSGANGEFPNYNNSLIEVTLASVPAITSFTPTTGANGTTITINGTNLTGASAVSIGGTVASSVNVVDANTVLAVIGTGATGTVSITTPSGTAVSSGTFTFIPAPTITSFTPTSGGNGAMVTITGTNLTGATAVSIGGTSADSVTVVNATTVTALVTTGTTGTISITTPGGTAVSSGTFTFVNPGGRVNYTITFTGSGAGSTVGEVVVQNLTQGTSVTVPAGNVLHLYDLLSQINQPVTGKTGIIIYQNVQQGNISISFFSEQAGGTQVNAFSIDGRKIAGINQNLQVGENSFQLALAKGVYVIQVAGTGYGYTAKLINPTNSPRNDEITYIGGENQTGSSPQKTKSEVAGITSMLYTAGDRLLYKAVSGNYSTIVTDIPTGTKTTNFDFEACQDADGNNYTVVTIGTQTWMAENLKTTQYNDSTTIPNITDNATWIALSTPGYCWYNNDANANKTTYGALYNYYVVNTGKLAPSGWHIPTYEEWNTLKDYLGGFSVAGGKLKEAGNAHWVSPNTAATNETGFSALPSGSRADIFYNLGKYGTWWGNGEYSQSSALCLDLYYNLSDVSLDSNGKSSGFSVRCIKDTLILPTLTTNYVTIQNNNTASGGGNISSDGGAVVTARGICWSTNTAPDITLTTKTSDGTGIGAYSSSISGLTAGTTYYVRAYATNSVGTAYGNELSFTTPAAPITDIDGNVYHSVTIGTQTWMVENLKTTKYRNGESIDNVTDNTTWDGLTTGAWCDLDNDVANGTKYGHLYNFYAVSDTLNIAPAGWHVATDAEWTILTDYLGGETIAGGKLKESGVLDWMTPNTGATNEVGFTAIPGGARNDNGGSFGPAGGYYAYWWTSTPVDSSITPDPSAWIRSMNYSISNVVGGMNNMKNGFSVRCVKD